MKLFLMGITLLLGATAAPLFSYAQPTGLKAPSDFASIADPAARSAEIFVEIAKVLEHPRCMNCHPDSRFPTQGDDLHAHVPFMNATEGDHGVPGLPCATCHTEHNVLTLGETVKSVPGTMHWGLAPSSMAWQGLTTAGICEQLTDPARNGNRTPAQIHTHITTDALIAWAFSPGPGRTTPPGSVEELGALLLAWIETGAHCPTD